MRSTLISAGDFIDLWYEVRRYGMRKVFRQIGSSSGQRTVNHFSCIDPLASGWWMIPAVRSRWNAMICGDEKTVYQDYIARRYWNGALGLNMLSVGCGGGTPEINFAQTGCFDRIDAFDLSPSIVRHAQSKAKRFELPQLHFFTADARQLDFGTEKYDAVLFHSSLHHLPEPEKILLKAEKSLVRNGFVIVNEYVGPERNQWTNDQLKAVNELLNALPENYRYRSGTRSVKKRIWRPGLLRMRMHDPSEAVNSSALPGMLREIFDTTEVKHYGGNILHPLLKDIAHHFMNDDEETKHWLRFLFDAEDAFIRDSKSEPDFILGIYRKKHDSMKH